MKGRCRVGSFVDRVVPRRFCFFVFVSLACFHFVSASVLLPSFPSLTIHFFFRSFLGVSATRERELQTATRSSMRRRKGRRESFPSLALGRVESCSAYRTHSLTCRSGSCCPFRRRVLFFGRIVRESPVKETAFGRPLSRRPVLLLSAFAFLKVFPSFSIQLV